MLELIQDQHARPVNWRWLCGEMLSDDPIRRDRFRGDARIAEAANFHRQNRALTTEEERVQLIHHHPGQFEAWCLECRDDSPLRRYSVQARLLADEPLPSIARKTDSSVSGIAYFESWFFDVRGRLDNPRYIVKQVPGRGDPSEPVRTRLRAAVEAFWLLRRLARAGCHDPSLGKSDPAERSEPDGEGFLPTRSARSSDRRPSWGSGLRCSPGGSS